MGNAPPCPFLILFLWMQFRDGNPPLVLGQHSKEQGDHLSYSRRGTLWLVKNILVRPLKVDLN